MASVAVKRNLFLSSADAKRLKLTAQPAKESVAKEQQRIAAFRQIASFPCNWHYWRHWDQANKQIHLIDVAHNHVYIKELLASVLKPDISLTEILDILHFYREYFKWLLHLQQIPYMNTLNYKKLILYILNEYAQFLVDLHLERLYGSEGSIRELIFEMLQAQMMRWFTKSAIRLLEMKTRVLKMLDLDRMISGYSLEIPEHLPGVEDFKAVDCTKIKPIEYNLTPFTLQPMALQKSYRATHRMPFNTKPLPMVKVPLNCALDYSKGVEDKMAPYTAGHFMNRLQKAKGQLRTCAAIRCKGECLHEDSVIWLEATEGMKEVDDMSYYFG